MNPVRGISPSKLAFYSAMARIRPISVGQRIKSILRIRRFPFQLADGRIYWVDPVSYQGLFLLRDGVYEPLVDQLLEIILRPGDVFFDIGANEGYFTIAAARLVRDEGRVIAVEPQSRVRSVLEQNIQANKLSSWVETTSAALMDKAGSAEIFLTPMVNSGASSIKKRYRRSTTTETVPVSTFEQLYEKTAVGRRIRLAKIDCEGAEPEIIAGAGKILTQQLADHLIIEYHPSFCGLQAIEETHDKVVAAGYEWIEIGPLHRLYFLPQEKMKTVPRVRELLEQQEKM